MPSEPLFLARESYRRRRLGDAARLLPWVGGALFLLPVMFTRQVGTAAAGLYLFGAWTALIVLAAVISRRLRHGEPPDR